MTRLTSEYSTMPSMVTWRASKPGASRLRTTSSGAAGRTSTVLRVPPEGTLPAYNWSPLPFFRVTMINSPSVDRRSRAAEALGCRYRSTVRFTWTGSRVAYSKGPL